jgi:NAD(P)-dependent dehydrogenase (short-subunit alcohol dehydrogenase family)
MAVSTGNRLAGKVAVVTGAGASGEVVGTGRAIATLFARQGARVVLADASRDQAQITLDDIAREGGQACVVEADVTRSDDCRRIIDAAVERFGGLHILVNNVGIGARGTVVNVDEDLLDRAWSVNLKSMVMMSKHAVPVLARAGGGSIINISSVDGIRAGMVRNIPYAIAKGGVNTLTVCMAAHHGREGIRVNAIAPGHIRGATAQKALEPLRDVRRRAAPLGTEGDAWDVAWAAVFLASDEARWISGAVLPVDGGLLTTTPLAALPYFQHGEPFTGQ